MGGGLGCDDPGMDPRPAEEPCTDDQGGSCETFMDLGPCRAYYQTSLDLSGYNPDVTRAVIAIHGGENSSIGHFRAVLPVIEDADALQEVVLIAPLYADNPSSSRTEWPFDDGYRDGEDVNCGGETRSPFEYTDELVRQVANCENFPSLESVVVIGHSAGGQHVARYAATTGIVQEFPRIEFKFVPTNPSSWVFLDDHRNVEGLGWVDSSVNSGSLPGNLQSCQNSYNRWGKGLDSLSQQGSYFEQLSAADVQTQWPARNIVYFLGEDDACDCNNLDTGCSANWQGEFRLNRGENMYEAVTMFFPPASGAVHELSTVPGVSHSHTGMYRSTAGRRHILQ